MAAPDDASRVAAPGNCSGPQKRLLSRPHVAPFFSVIDGFLCLDMLAPAPGAAPWWQLPEKGPRGAVHGPPAATV